MNAELLHLFMQQNCLEQHLVLWRATVRWAFADSENVGAETNLGIHLSPPFHFTVKKTKAPSREDIHPKTPAESQS